MTTIQKIALHIMTDENIGAVLVAGHGWVFPCHIRKSIEVAQAVVETLAK